MRGQLRRQLGLRRVDLLLEEVGQRRDELGRARVVGEVHRQPFESNCRRPHSANGMTNAPTCSNPGPTVWPLMKRRWIPSRITASLYAANPRYQPSGGTETPTTEEYTSTSSSNGG